MVENICGWQWIDYPSVGSTNDEAKNICSAVDVKKIVITAVEQTQGRGRRGRNWISDSGNLFMSQLYKPQHKISDLVFISSLSIAQTVLSFSSDLDVKIKWPNDVLLDNKKFCGILIEAEKDYVIIGIGVNLNSCPSDQDIIYPATDIASYGLNLSRLDFLQKYLSIFNENTKLYKQNGFNDIRLNWLKYAYRLNQEIKIKNNSAIQGIYKGIDENGFLLLEQDNKVTKISVGDIFI